MSINVEIVLMYFFMFLCYRCESSVEGIGTIPRRWLSLNRPPLKLTKEASTSMEDLSMQICSTTPGTVMRPKSMCVPDMRYINNTDSEENVLFTGCATNDIRLDEGNNNRRVRLRRNPVNRAASRLYRASVNVHDSRDCTGPEFVVRAVLPTKQITMPDFKGPLKKSVVVIMLDGQKLDVLCNPNSTTAGQLFEVSFIFTVLVIYYMNFFLIIFFFLLFHELSAFY